MMRLLYTFVLFVLLPWALLHLWLRARRQPAYLDHVAERFGFSDAHAGDPLIWVHAVSVGETQAAEPLIKALRQRHSSHRILITHTTPTGRQAGVELFGDGVIRCYLPYDFPFAVKRFLRRFRPQVGIVMETEIWPNLIEHCHRRSIPVYLVNARMSEKSALGYAHFRGLAGAALRKLAGIGAQTERDAARLVELGARAVKVTGNIKFDRTAPPDMLALGTRLRDLFGSRKVLLAASTREGEETLILDALAGLDMAELLVVIVPRHPQRFDEVGVLLRQRGHAFVRRSEGRPVGADVRVVLGDSMGEMFAYYCASDVAFVGGSLAPLGGQNLLEACAVGRPVIVGPHTFNFEEATEGAIEAGAALRVADAPALAAAVVSLFRDPGRREAMAEAGRLFTQRHRGATERTMAMLKWKTGNEEGRRGFSD
ncbi:MAG TPA: lipid IV(A) 3-deoxy-D-manno-octulosonic acid transferase [Casimicrobiaceae bacterium]|jgi:3-deoxy-D-manno-octulosonic-acid transferase|nr:lipid IV(A) 3-deoxy-D-manno-octulosonic acid transferase [Casimicrobiaceae bacterium]